MAIKFISKIPPADRRALRLDPASPAVIKPGQAVVEDASNYAVLADSANDVTAPKWAFTDSERVDAADAQAVTVVEGPFTAEMNTLGYDGTPAKGDAMKFGTGGTAGKLITFSPSTVADALDVVAYCERPANAEGFARFRVIR
jgi:hypothetical protein